MSTVHRPCVTSHDCSYLYECIDVKLPSGITELECVHDGIFKADPETIIGFILLPILIGIGNVGGLGGGITKVPIMMILMNFTQRQATYQAYCIQFGACIVNTILLFMQRHPTRDRPIIDYNVGLVLVPVVTLGTTLGIYANNFLPEIACNLMFIVFLISVMPFLFKKSMRLNREEKEEALKKEQETPLIEQEEEDNENVKQQDKLVVQDEPKGFTRTNGTDDNMNINKQSEYTTDSINTHESQVNQNHEKLQPIIDLESKKLPPLKFSIIVASFLVVQFINFSIGTKTIDSIFGFSRCSAGFWVFTALLPICTLALNFVGYKILTKEEQIKQEYGYNYDKDDLPINNKNYAKIWGSGFISGFLAGSLGAGGGLSMVTFMMAIGLKGRVASATTGMNNFFIGLTSILSVITNSSIPIDQILMFTGVALLGSLVISKVIYKIVQKYNKTSMVVMFVFALAVLNVFSNVAYIVQTESRFGWKPLVSTNPFC